MPKIRVERVPVQTLFLGLLGFDHLQLVYQQNDADTGAGQDAWFVMEGLRESGLNGATLAVEGLDGGTTLTEANGGLSGEDLVARIGTPAERGSRVAFDAGATPAWAFITSVAADIDQQAYPYFAFNFAASPAPTINSSSLIASLLYHAGADIAALMPFGIRFSPGTETVLGTSGDDRIELVSKFTTVVGGAGKDTLIGSENADQTDKLYGGTGDDTIVWSPGFNVVHGGLTGLDYASDGIDTINYQGVGLVEINLNPYAVAHYQPDYIAVSGTSTDHLYSIEQIAWDEDNDIVVFGEGVSSIQRPVKLDLRGEEGGSGDKVDFSGSDQGLLINAGEGELTFVQAEGRSETDAGLWVESAEWLVGSSHDDRIYAGADVHAVEGGEGADLIDARLVAQFSGSSPRGFDVEIDGGAGSDTIVSGFGRTIAKGGDGADRFVLSTMTFGLETVEFVIEDASAEDRAFVPYDFFNITYGDAEGSALFPLLGAFSQQPGQDSFADLPENLGPWTAGTPGRADFFRFEWQLQDQRLFGSDETQGLITFAGMILYNREGNDLLIHVFLGFPVEVTEPGSNELPWTHTLNIFIPPSETIIRVKDFVDGDLGIVFHDLGEPTPIDIETDHGSYGADFYPGWDDAVAAMTNGGQMSPALEARPEAPEYDPADEGPGDEENVVPGTDDDDAIVIADARDTTIEAGCGDDTIEAGGGDDVLDGGAGADSMAGGKGDDIYLVDEAGDEVIEAAGEGIDTVRAAIDYALPDYVEHLTLVSAGGGLSLLAVPALMGTGNGLANRMLGNEGSNTLFGLGGADTLFGGLGGDLLDGGAGSDGYVYAAGHGDDVIVDQGPASDRDLLLLSGIAPGAVSFHKLSSAPDDLVLTFDQGGRILIRDFWTAPGAGIDAIQFDDRTLWSRAEIEARGLAAPVLDGDPPQAQDDFDLVVRGSDVALPWDAFLANDHDFDGDTLSIVSVSGATAGAAVTIAGSSLHLVTAPSFEGPVGFTYEVSDGHGGVDTAEVEIVVDREPCAGGHRRRRVRDRGRDRDLDLRAGAPRQRHRCRRRRAQRGLRPRRDPRRGGARRQRAYRVYARHRILGRGVVQLHGGRRPRRLLYGHRHDHGRGAARKRDHRHLARRGPPRHGRRRRHRGTRRRRHAHRQWRRRSLPRSR